jgi:hypothetical protein
VIDELRKIAGANVADYMKSTTDGDPYLDLSALTRGQTTALSAARACPPRSALADASAEFERVQAPAHRADDDASSISIWPSCMPKTIAGPGNGWPLC